jgi:hypothetical protein
MELITFSRLLTNEIKYLHILTDPVFSGYWSINRHGLIFCITHDNTNNFHFLLQSIHTPTHTHTCYYHEHEYLICYIHNIFYWVFTTICLCNCFCRSFSNGIFSGQFFLNLRGYKYFYQLISNMILISIKLTYSACPFIAMMCKAV